VKAKTIDNYLAAANEADLFKLETVVGRAKVRSARHGELVVPPTRTKTFGSRSFRSAAPTVWNSLPQHVRQSEVSRGQLTSRLKRGCLVVRIRMRHY